MLHHHILLQGNMLLFNATCVVHGLQQLRDQNLILRLLLLQKAQFLPHDLQVEAVVQIQVLVHDSLRPVRWQLRGKSLCQLHQVPPADRRLGLVRVPARVVGGVANEIWIKPEGNEESWDGHFKPRICVLW